jgi:hypothetical protein
MLCQVERIAHSIFSLTRFLNEESPFRLHAPITKENIAEKLKKHFSLVVDPKNILLNSPITELGSHKVRRVSLPIANPLCLFKCRSIRFQFPLPRRRLSKSKWSFTEDKKHPRNKHQEPDFRRKNHLK